MVKNDCYDWSPRTRMLLINLAVDKVVDPENTEKSLETMRWRGVFLMMRRPIKRENKKVFRL